MEKQKEIYTHAAPWPVYGLHWSRRPGTFRLGYGSFLEEYTNKVCMIIDFKSY